MIKGENLLLKKLVSNQIDLICLAGYMKLLSRKIVEKYDNCILNIHPALLPKFGGKGFYGDFVHKSVLDANESKSGITIHLVNEKYDDVPPDDLITGSRTNTINSAISEKQDSVLFKIKESTKTHLKNEYLKNFLSTAEINNLPENWAISYDLQNSSILLGYLWGIFYPISTSFCVLLAYFYVVYVMFMHFFVFFVDFYNHRISRIINIFSN